MAAALAANSVRSAPAQEGVQDSGGEGGGWEAGEEGGEHRSAGQEELATLRDRVAEDLEIVAGGLGSLSSVWEELAEAADLPLSLPGYLLDAVGRLRDDIGPLVEAGVGQSSGKALETVTAMSAIQDGVAELQAGAETVGAQSANMGSPVARTLAWIMKALNRAAKWLWTLITHLVTPKEWSLTGGITMPGLAHASISVTFG